MIDLPAYSGPHAGCPKCRTGNLTTNYHYGSRATKETPHGEGWPCTWFDREDYGLEYLCHYCRTCGYTRPEALPAGSGDTGAGTVGPGPFFPGTDLDGEAGRPLTLARWCRDSAHAELGAGGWGDGQKAALTRSFEDLVDTWTTYKCVLASATAAFEDIASAIAAQNPELDRAECRRSAQFILESTARQIREGQYMIVHHPGRLSHAPYDGDDFMKLVRSLPKGTVIHGCSNDGL
ncbi:MAG TPA: hypothetical protein VMV07_27730 [Streptosporangiaceae bacterium]|nr:hypothetical protein [Streptosporangiaceae bacterium]